MKRFLLPLFLLAAAAVPSMAQQPAPNCQINFSWTDVATSPVSFNAGVTQCAYWVISYQVSGFSAVSLQFESATGVAGTPGTFGAFSGTVTSGSNPLTATSCSTPSDCRSTFTGVVGWYRVNFVSHTGNGSIQGTLQGYKTYQGLGGDSPSLGGCAGTISTPCIVAGPNAAGAAPTKNPVLVGGIDGTDTRTILTDTSGRQIQVGASPAGSSVVGNPVNIGGTDGTNVRTVKTDTGGNLQEAFIGLGTFNAGQQAVTGTAAALPSASTRAVCVTALSTNTISIFLGPTGVTASTGLELQPGQATCQPVSNSNLIFVVAATTGATATWSLVN